MKQRTLDEMISYFNQQVSGMEIDRKYKIALLGMITAIGYESRKQERKWETCFDCPLSHGCPKINGCTNDQAEQYASEIPDDCPIERKPGRWRDYPIADGCIQCSICGVLRLGEPSNFCPNCGAKMEV